MTMRAIVCRALAGSLALSPVVAPGLRVQVASDTGCDKAARIIAKGADTTVQADRLVTWSPGCSGRLVADRRDSPPEGSPRPADYEARVRAALASLAGCPARRLPR